MPDTEYHGWTHAPGGVDPVGVGDEWVEIQVTQDDVRPIVGDGARIFFVPPSLNGKDLVEAIGFVTTVSSSGSITIQLRNVTHSVDMLSTKITIDGTEFDSLTAATPPVIGTPGVVTGDQIAIDVDSIGTGMLGLGVALRFE